MEIFKLNYAVTGIKSPFNNQKERPKERVSELEDIVIEMI